MRIYLGNSGKLRLRVGNGVCRLIIPALFPIFNGVRLLSSDNYILTDSNGVYLIAKEDK